MTADVLDYRTPSLSQQSQASEDNSYARLELTRTTSGEGWTLPKGTLVIGRLSGSELDHAFVNVLGYVDPNDNGLVVMNGEVLGSDGATGLPGKGEK